MEPRRWDVVVQAEQIVGKQEEVDAQEDVGRQRQGKSQRSTGGTKPAFQLARTIDIHSTALCRGQ